MFNKSYIFFFLVVLLGIGFNIIQKNATKLTDNNSFVELSQENSNEKSRATNLSINKLHNINNFKENWVLHQAEQYTEIETKPESLIMNPHTDDSVNEVPIQERAESKLTVEEQLKIGFLREFKRARFPLSKQKKFIIDSVFEREKDENWSSSAEVRLLELMSELAIEYNFESDLGEVKCSDVMCFIGLKKNHKLPHMVYNSTIMGAAGFGPFKYYNGGKSKKGMYVRRFRSKHRSSSSN